MGIVTSATAIGPRGYQEDRAVVIRMFDGYLLAVFDGHFSSAVSIYCAERLPEIVTEIEGYIPAHDKKFNFLRTIVHMLVEENKYDTYSGSTVSLAYIHEDENYADIVVLGDSPIIVVDADGNSWVSPEHNVCTNSIERMRVIMQGATYLNGYAFIEERGRFDRGIELTRALGDKHFDKFMLREPECFSIELGNSSIVAVMSDGVYGGCIQKSADLSLLPLDNAEVIVADALARGTHDNVTAIVWRAKE